MAEEIGFENGRNSNFQGLMTLNLTLDTAIWHTVLHNSSTSIYVPNVTEIGRKIFSNVTTEVLVKFIPSCITHRPLPIYQISFKSKKLFVDGRTYGRIYRQTDIFPLILLGRLLEVDVKIV